MSAEQLIALEAAMADLSRLYAAAKMFTALETRAEAELWPRINTLGVRLRTLVRRSQLTEEEVDTAAHEILALGSAWRLSLEGVHDSVLYRDTMEAYAADHQERLARLIPLVFASLQQVQPVPSLYLPVSPSAGRRRPGTSPFLSAVACAEKIEEMLAGGIVPAADGTEWWERDLPALSCADCAGALDTPIALRLAAADVRVAVFAAADDPALQVFTPRLRGPMSVVLAVEAGDEWWEAYEDSYESFRTTLEAELLSRKVDVVSE